MPEGEPSGDSQPGGETGWDQVSCPPNTPTAMRLCTCVDEMNAVRGSDAMSTMGRPRSSFKRAMLLHRGVLCRRSSSGRRSRVFGRGQRALRGAKRLSCCVAI